MDATLLCKHLLLLPDKAYKWILGGFAPLLEVQAETAEEDLILGPFPYVAVGGTSGWGTQTLAPKSWANAFLADAIRLRPLPSDP
jgi:hypothetical protein